MPTPIEQIKKLLENLYQDEHPVDCIDGETPVETYGYEETHNYAIKDNYIKTRGRKIQKAK